jgi:hypothetical protein
LPYSNIQMWHKRSNEQKKNPPPRFPPQSAVRVTNLCWPPFFHLLILKKQNIPSIRTNVNSIQKGFMNIPRTSSLRANSFHLGGILMLVVLTCPCAFPNASIPPFPSYTFNKWPKSTPNWRKREG